YERACEGDHALSCEYAGRMHDEGRGVEASEEAARPLFEKACERGDALGCDMLRDLNDRVHPIEKAVVRVIIVGYAGAKVTRNPRARAKPRRRERPPTAHTTPRKAGAMGAGEHGAPNVYGKSSNQESVWIRRKSPEPLQDAVFALKPGKATMIENPTFGFEVV